MNPGSLPPLSILQFGSFCLSKAFTPRPGRLKYNLVFNPRFRIIQLVLDLIFYLVLFCNWQNPSNLCSTELFPFVLKNCSKVWTKVSTMPFDRGAVECVYDTVFFLKLAIFSRWLRPERYIVMHLCRVHTNTYHIEEQMTLRWCWTLLVGGQLSLLNCCIIYM